MRTLARVLLLVLGVLLAQTRTSSLLRLACERRKNEIDSENDREPDQPHGHLGGGRLPGSQAERHDAHQHARRTSTRYSMTCSACSSTNGGINAAR